MNDTQKDKIRRFLNDEVMSSAVYDVVLGAFLKQKQYNDVYTLAASRLALNLLEDAWRELQKYRQETEDVNKNGGNIAL